MTPRLFLGTQLVAQLQRGQRFSLAFPGVVEMTEVVSWLAHGYTGLACHKPHPCLKKPKKLIPSPRKVP